MRNRKSKKSKEKYTNNEELNKIIDYVFNKISIKDNKTRKLVVKIIKFVIVGGIATIISGLVFFLSDSFLKTSVLISNTFAFIISVTYNYWASCKYVFEINKEKNRFQRFIEFIVLAIIGYFLTQVLLWLMAEIWNWNHMVSWVIATIIVMIFNFITRSILLEKKQQD